MGLVRSFSAPSWAGQAILYDSFPIHLPESVRGFAVSTRVSASLRVSDLVFWKARASLEQLIEQQMDF